MRKFEALCEISLIERPSDSTGPEKPRMGSRTFAMARSSTSRE
jgi:hypothetical protein